MHLQWFVVSPLSYCLHVAQAGIWQHYTATLWLMLNIIKLYGNSIQFESHGALRHNCIQFLLQSGSGH